MSTTAEIDRNRSALPDANSAKTPLRRILFVDHTAKMGGGEIALLNLVRCIDRTRFQPVILLFSDGPLRQTLSDESVETHLIPLAAEVIDARKDSLGGGSFFRIKGALHAMAHVWRVRQFIRAQHIDLVHTNSLKADILGGVASRLACRPLVWHVRDRIADDYLPAKVVRLFRFLCRHLPGTVVTNSAATMATVFPVNPGKMAARSHVVHDGTSLMPEAAEEISVGKPLTRIGLVGRIAPWKGQDIFIKAAAKVHAKFPEARFLIVGSAMFAEDNFGRQLRDLVHALALDEVVEFTGFRADVAEVFRQLDLVVHASTTGEPFGQVVIEGMSAGKPIVATNGGGIPEIVVDQVTGLLVPMNDADAMADAICRLLAGPAEARQMGRRGRQRVADCFTIERTAQNVEKLYDQILNPA